MSALRWAHGLVAQVDRRDVLGLIGLGLVAKGGAALSVPWTQIILGAVCLAVAVLSTIPRGRT